MDIQGIVGIGKKGSRMAEILTLCPESSTES